MDSQLLLTGSPSLELMQMWSFCRSGVRRYCVGSICHALLICSGMPMGLQSYLGRLIVCSLASRHPLTTLLHDPERPFAIGGVKSPLFAGIWRWWWWGGGGGGGGRVGLLTVTRQ
jgi:hypothetical protein